MSTLFDPTLSLSPFQLPPQDIQLLSFCESNKLVKVQTWAANLKLTQVKQSSVELYQAAPEIARLKTDVKTRFEMLESLWAPAQQCLLGLSSEFLQQPLILPEKAQTAAILAQALQKHLLDGYCICIRELVDQKRLKSGQNQLLVRAIARALSAINILVLRAYQLYTDVPSRMWLRAHVLFQVAEYYDIQDQNIPASGLDNPTLRNIKDTYVRLLALGCVRPNQLSQQDIQHTYRALAGWAKHIQLFPSSTQDQNNLYLACLGQDNAPILKDRFDGSPDERVVEIDFQSLVGQLSKLSGQKNGDTDWNGQTSITIPTEIPDTLVAHILDCWSNSALRHQDRTRAEIEADACIGMIDCHYHLCGAIEFPDFLNPRHSEVEGDGFLSGGFDSLINSLSSKNKDIDNVKQPRQNVFKIVIQNISAGGYCILWKGELPAKIESGELIGLREKGRRAWSIGVIRWIRQLKNASQLGVQLLTNQPVPYGAAVMYDMGGYSDHMRAIHIPAPVINGQPPSLLTNAMPFQENSRVKLKQDEHNVDIRLNRCVFSTGKLRLFAFDTLSSKEEEF